MKRRVAGYQALKLGVPGYQHFRVGRVNCLALDACAADVRSALADGTIHAFAARQPDARAMHGRGVAFAVTLGTCGRVVVRHAHRGGVLGRVNRDLFLSPFRPLREVIASLRLRLTGVPTPEVVACAIYPARIGYRYDVVTREIEGGADLAAWLRGDADASWRSAMLDATATLLEALLASGAHHADLNAKNVLLVPAGSGFAPYVLDVDRVRFHVARSPMVRDANLARLLRSLRKLASRGLTVSDAEISSLEQRALALHRERTEQEQEKG